MITARPSAAGASSVSSLTEILAAHGFEPRPHKEGIALANCPFQRIAQEQPQLVCGMTWHLLAE